MNENPLVYDAPENVSKGLSFVSYPDGHYEMSVFKPFEGKRYSGRKVTEREEQDDLTIEAANRRAKRVVRQKCQAIGADRMLTFTYRANQQDLKLLIKHWKHFLKRCKRAKLEFDYVAVPETQERGALHLHVAINRFLPIQVIQYHWNKVIGGYGNVDVTSPYGKKVKTFKSYPSYLIADYIAKYIDKEMKVQFGKKRYYSTKGIEIKRTVKYCDIQEDDIWYFILFNELTGKHVYQSYKSEEFKILWVASWPNH